MKRTLRCCCLLLTAAFVLPAVAFAEKSPKELLADAYAQTKEAKSADDYTAIIDLCQQAQSMELAETSDKYAKQLLSWALNRRGEAYVDQAAKVLEAGKEDHAADLDARALKDFEAAIESDPTRWKAIHNRGVSKALVGEYDQAIADFSKVIEMQPEYVNAWFNRGEIHYELQQFDKAVEDYTKVAELDPEDVGAFTSRGHANFQRGKFADALEDYSRAIELDDQNANALANRGDAHQALQMWEKAAADYRKAIELDPDSGRAYRSAAWLMATCPDQRFRNVKLGVQAAERAVELHGTEDIEALDTLAAAYANADRYDEAAEAVGKAIELAAGTDVDLLTARLELYTTDRPYRQPRNETARADTATETQ